MASSFATVIFGLSVFIVVVNAAILDFNFKKLIDLNDPDNQEFSDLIDKYKMKLNNPADLTKRLGIFRKAKEALKGFQAKQKNAQFALNKFSLMSEDEQKQVIHFSFGYFKSPWWDTNAETPAWCAFVPSMFHK